MEATVERKLVTNFDKENNFHFGCSSPNCSWDFAAAVRDPRHSSQEDPADFKAQAEESFKNHVCSKYRQPE
jgi:hypothetical protein